MKIIDSFRNENEGYITIPALKKFLKKNNIKMNGEYDRESLLELVEKYADSHEETVLSWLDDTLKEGKKDIYIYNYAIEDLYNNILCNDTQLAHLLKDDLSKNIGYHLNQGGFECELKLLTYKVREDETAGRVVSLYFGKKIYVFDKPHSRIINYPLFIDIYVNQHMLVARLKPKSNLYEYKDDGFDIEDADKINIEKLMEKAVSYVNEKFNLKGIKDNKNILEEKLYLMLDNYTKTPKEINDLLMQQEGTIQANVESVLENCGLNAAMYKEDVIFDVRNMYEKYFSINYPDKSIFTKDRAAYPLRILATDDEESKVDQKACAEEPLQSKAIFFDNKKMLQKTRTCERVVFKFKRKESMYFGEEFLITIKIKKESCYMKFTEYTAEEDIINVIFSLINIR